MGIENGKVTGEQLGEEFYRTRIHDLEGRQHGLSNVSYEWTVLQEDLEFARLKWKQLTRRVSLKPFWVPKPR